MMRTFLKAAVALNLALSFHLVWASSSSLSALLCCSSCGMNTIQQAAARTWLQQIIGNWIPNVSCLLQEGGQTVSAFILEMSTSIGKMLRNLRYNQQTNGLLQLFLVSKIPTPLLDPPTHPPKKTQLRKYILIWECLWMLFVPLFDGIMSFSLLSLPFCVQIKTCIRSVLSSSWTWMMFPSVGFSTFESLVNCWCFIWSPFLSAQSLILFLLWLYDPLHSIQLFKK